MHTKEGTDTMGMSLAVVSQKGGVGKTTLAANLAAAFADFKFRTLLIEVDPQGSLARCFGLDRFDLHHGLYGCLTSGTVSQDSVEKEIRENLDLLPANVWSHEEESALTAVMESDPLGLRALVRALAPEYDYVILDGPPALGPLTRAALTAVDRYIVPVQAEAMNTVLLSRLDHLAGDVRTAHNPDLILEGYVITMADLRTRHAANVVESLSLEHPDSLFRTIIPRSIRIADEPVQGRPTVAGPQGRARKALQDLAEEILSRHSRQRASAGDEAVDWEDPEDTATWERVLSELPEDDEPAARASGNGTGWDN
jgi:chromosome partitioning protein